MECLAFLKVRSPLFFCVGDKPLARDAGRSGREARRLEEDSEQNPGAFGCHPRSLGDAELPLLAFTGEAPFLVEEGTLPPPLDMELILLSVGVEDLGVGDAGLLGGLECLPETGKPVADREDGLRPRGLTLLLLLLPLLSVCEKRTIFRYEMLNRL